MRTDWVKMLEEVDTIICPNCGNTHAKKSISVVRPAGAGNSHYFECFNCGFKWDGLEKIGDKYHMKKPTIIEIGVKAMDDTGIEKEFYFNSLDDFNNWWRDPYEVKKE